MDNKWVLVANASEAYLYETERLGKEMHLIKTFSHPESRAKGAELVSDRPGRTKADSGYGMATRGDPDEAKALEADRFARELADVLNKGRTNNAYRYLALAAAPHFQGLLKSHLNEHTLEKVTHIISKDFTTCDLRELPKRLKENAQEFALN
ncbi:MAG TPA: host attachment protein [Gammaproteobacteria bacterium]|nr:host attachment protein [Gammaproteobacteria bacterium]